MTDLTAFTPHRILVCQLHQLGDVLLATPALQLLKEHWPEAEVHLFTEKKCLPLLEGNPHLEKIWAVDKQKLSNLYRELRWYLQVAHTNFDLVVDFQQLPRCRWVVAFSQARIRLSHTAPWYNRLLYTHCIPLQPGYAAQMKVSILAPLGITWHKERPRIYLTQAERTASEAMLRTLGLRPGQRLITLDTTHRRETRRWPVRHYAGLVHLLVEADPSLRFLPLWGPGEEGYIQQLVAVCPEGTLLLPTRMLSIREMAACIARADLHVGNCSAPRHIAVAVDTPSCTILGSTSATWTFPSPQHRHVTAGLPCQPCNHNTCPHTRCLQELAPATVVHTVQDMLITVCAHRNR